MTLEELQDLIRRLQRLMDDPHPGLFTWNKAIMSLTRQIGDYGRSDK